MTENPTLNDLKAEQLMRLLADLQAKAVGKNTMSAKEVRRLVGRMRSVLYRDDS